MTNLYCVLYKEGLLNQKSHSIVSIIHHTNNIHTYTVHVHCEAGNNIQYMCTYCTCTCTCIIIVLECTVHYLYVHVGCTLYCSSNALLIILSCVQMIPLGDNNSWRDSNVVRRRRILPKISTCLVITRLENHWRIALHPMRTRWVWSGAGP